MNDEKAIEALPGDNPIWEPGQDALERADAAAAFARQVLALDASEGVAVGVFGPWGSGKTSFVNLARPVFDRAGAPVLDFNPWMFSGAEQLVGRFFAELSAQMSERSGLESIVTAIGKYGNTLSGPAGILASLLGGPLAGQSASVLLKAIGDLAHPPESVNRLRDKVVHALNERDKPIIVVLDDVDRLSGHEIREVFKLVRLTASFPNVVYIVPCDRLRIEQALDEKEQGLSGSDYLEKIIQFPYNLPEIPYHILREQIDAAIDAALDEIEECSSFDQQVWPFIRNYIVRPLIGNMRDVRRYSAAIRGTVVNLGGEVALADVLGLEAVRLFLPDVFRHLPGATGVLTTPSESRLLEREIDETHSELLMGKEGLNQSQSRLIDNLIGVSGEKAEVIDEKRRDVVYTMIHYLFPAASQYIAAEKDGLIGPIVPVPHSLAECRVAQESILRVYLERIVGYDLLRFKEAERALEYITNPDRLGNFMHSLDLPRRRDVVSHLGGLKDNFQPSHAEPGIVALFKLMVDIPAQRQSPYAGIGGDLRRDTNDIAVSLLRTLQDAATAEAAVRRILPRLSSLSAKVELILLVGHRENIGCGLVSETKAVELEGMVRNEIKSASAVDLAEERYLTLILGFARTRNDSSGDQFDIPDDVRLTFAVLWCGRQTEAIETVDWKLLVELHGNEETLKTRIESLNARFDDLKPWLESRGIALEDVENVIELAQKYVSERRPE